ncbi:MAG TPA: DUF2272 domain-containing protein [Allosphingosinicella sp.]|nr:DUF2272 domain-containing protein [Allosphingosinicella sp.]
MRQAEQELSDYEGQFENGGQLRARIGEYWTFLNHPNRDGASPYAWSAAFISFLVNRAGAEDSFPYSGQHSVYFYRLIRDRLRERDVPFWGYRRGEVEIGPGDIIGMNRGDAATIDYDQASGDADYLSHADIVVHRDADGTLHTIGGNVGRRPGQIGRKAFVQQDERLVNRADPDQQVFVVLRNRLA